MRSSRSGDHWDESRINLILVKAQVHKFKNASSKFVSSHFEVDRPTSARVEHSSKKSTPIVPTSIISQICNGTGKESCIKSPVRPAFYLLTYLVNTTEWIGTVGEISQPFFFPSAGLFSLCRLKKLDCLWLIAKGGLISESFSLWLKL